MMMMIHAQIECMMVSDWDNRFEEECTLWMVAWKFLISCPPADSGASYLPYESANLLRETNAHTLPKLYQTSTITPCQVYTCMDNVRAFATLLANDDEWQSFPSGSPPPISTTTTATGDHSTVSPDVDVDGDSDIKTPSPQPPTPSPQPFYDLYPIPSTTSSSPPAARIITIPASPGKLRYAFSTWFLKRLFQSCLRFCPG